MEAKRWMIVVLALSGLLVACDKQSGGESEADASVGAGKPDAAATEPQKTAPSASVTQAAPSPTASTTASATASAAPSAARVDAGKR